MTLFACRETLWVAARGRWKGGSWTPVLHTKVRGRLTAVSVASWAEEGPDASFPANLQQGDPQPGQSRNTPGGPLAETCVRVREPGPGPGLFSRWRWVCSQAGPGWRFPTLPPTRRLGSCPTSEEEAQRSLTGLLSSAQGLGP